MIEAMKRSGAGFTLVELIVVIAILGILAGISIPVYSGYIEKAGKAADMQLLGAMNTAFAAACASKGRSPTDVEAGVVWTDNRVTGVTPEYLNDDFVLFYGDNASIPFKTFTSIGYDKEQGIFVGDGGVVYMDYTRADGTTVTLALNAEDVNAYKESIFNTSGDITAAQLMEKVQGVANQAAGAISLGNKSIEDIDELLGGTVYYLDAQGNRVSQEEYTSRLVSLSEEFYNANKEDTSYYTNGELDTFKLGRAADAYAKAQLNMTKHVENGAYTTYLRSLGMTDSDISSMSATQKANALVLMAAQGASGLTAQDVLESYYYEYYDDGDDARYYGGFRLNPENGVVNSISAMSIPYALAMAYAYSDGATIQQTESVSLADLSDGTIPKTWNGVTYTTNKDYLNARFGEGNWTTTGTGSNKTYVGTYTVSAKDYFDSASASMSSAQDLGVLVDNICSSTEFQSYVGSQQAAADTEGFLAALNMINDNAANVGWEELLNNGYNSDTLKGIVSTLVGETYTPAGTN